MDSHVLSHPNFTQVKMGAAGPNGQRQTAPGSWSGAVAVRHRTAARRPTTGRTMKGARTMNISTTARSWGIGVTAVIATAAGLHLSEGRADSASYTLPTNIRALNTPCPAEDSLDCFWNAHQQGNGHGASFVALRFKLLGVNGRRIGVVACHQLNNRWDEYSSCQVMHRRHKGGE